MQSKMIAGKKHRAVVLVALLLLTLGAFAGRAVAQGVCDISTLRVAAVRGRVVTPGVGGDDPVAQARVELRRYAEGEPLVASTLSDADGFFVLSNPGRGTYWLMAGKEPLSRYPVKLKVSRRASESEAARLIVIKLGADPFEPCGGGGVKLQTGRSPRRPHDQRG